MLSSFPQKIAPFFMEKLFALTQTEYKDYSKKINGVNFSESARFSSFLDFIPINNEYEKKLSASDWLKSSTFSCNRNAIWSK